MNLRSNQDWTPVSREQFESIAECPCFRSEQYGDERVFVVARSAKQRILFDDVEDEFAIGEPDDDGVLRDWGLYGDLIDAVRGLPKLE
jgi:hypothetical protein